MTVLAFVALALFQLMPSSAERAPFRSPQIAVSPQFAAMAYGSGKGIYVATSTKQGQSFSAPVKVADAEVLPLSRHRGPRVVISKQTIVVTAVVGDVEATGPHAHGLPSDADLYAWRSSDMGRTWSKGVRVNDVPGAAREGLHALTSDGGGNLFAVWLDLRGEGTRLYGSFSRDAGATWSANQLVYQSPDGSICQCCHPSAAYSSNGALDVMWRNCVDGARDFYLVRSTNGRRFSKPVKLGTGTWKINACPMDGGGLTHDGARVITAWRREQDIFLAEPGRPEVKLGTGHDVAIAATQGHVLAVWIANQQVELWEDGRISNLAPAGSFPNIVALPSGGALAAWEENGGISLRRLP